MLMVAVSVFMLTAYHSRPLRCSSIAGLSSVYESVLLLPACRYRLLSRSDIFKPLFQEDYEDFLEKEKEAMATGQGLQATW